MAGLLAGPTSTFVDLKPSCIYDSLLGTLRWQKARAMLRRMLLIGLLAVVAVLLCAAGGMYWAVTSAQPYYEAELQKPREVLRESSRQLESRFTTLHSDLQSQGTWQTVISADELNGWLAYKLPESFPDLLPEEVRDPRVAITAQDVILAARSNLGGVNAVVSVFVEPFVTDEGDLAVQLNQVLAGSLPIPTTDVIHRLSRATRRAGLPIRWTQSDGKTVMIVANELWNSEENQNRTLDAVELADGEMFLSGRTEVVDDGPSEVEIAAQEFDDATHWRDTSVIGR